MPSGDSNRQDGDAGYTTPLAGRRSPSPSFSENWKERILIPTVLAGAGGGGFGLVSKQRTVQGFPHVSAAYAANFAIVTGCYCGAREFVRVTRKSDPDDLLNSAIAGFSTGALLGRFQAGQLGAIRYSFIFAVAGTSVDFATIKLRPKLKSLKESIFGSEENKDGGWKLPEWFPIQVLDEEALAKKEAREKQLHAQRAALAKLTKGES
ncbi:unnamed protein product [Linum tenue]|uniref:Uncharacterized protein n=1 Tax=Linum tenue TaxID=586396 RepID=A0AAV0JZL0_9ROSI|nr:unnamed protein product [Linum tenue]